MSLVLLMGAVVLAVAAPPVPAVRFAVIGDRNGGNVKGIYEGIIAEVERMKPDFCVTVGDQIDGYTEDTTELDRQWQEYKAIVKGLTMPLYLTPGNHDITSGVALGPYLRNAGRPYYSFDQKGLHFVIVDVSRWDTGDSLPKEQLDWLAADLKKAQKARSTFVFFHKPFWEETVGRGKRDTLHGLFKAYGVDAVFCGHTHTYASAEYDGIKYTAVGTSGGEGRVHPTGLDYSFTWVTVDTNGIAIAPIKAGSARPWDDVTVQDLYVIDKIERTGLKLGMPVTVDENLKAGGRFDVTVKNPSAEVALAETLKWDIPEGWAVEPTQLPVQLEPGASMMLVFTTRNSAALFPVPEMTLAFPYAQGKSNPAQASLRVARTARCVRAAAGPVIDGDLGDGTWKKPETRMFGYNGAPLKTDSMKFYFAWDDANLYLAAKCFDPAPEAVVAKAVKQDDAVHLDDCAGYFFQPDTARGEVYQIYLNPNGVAFDQKITVADSTGANADPKWSGGYDVKGARGSGFWSIEAKIPFAQLNATAKPGDVWGLNFRRKQPGKKANADWQTPISSDPATFGYLKFE